MKLTEKQTLLFDFVKQQHGEQVRKYTGEPYWHHLLSVATIVSEYEPTAIEIALCHDLFEDTNCSQDELFTHLCLCGYDSDSNDNIIDAVIELTDEFTNDGYPSLNRKKRKSEEAKRLGGISSIAQSVKYADLIDNTSSIVQHDKGFAKIYLEEKKEILSLMRSGHPDLLRRCENVLEEALELSAI